MYLLRQKRDKLSDSDVESLANGTYPLLRADALALCHRVLQWKQELGNDAERAVYGDLDLLAFVQRLIANVREGRVNLMGHR